MSTADRGGRKCGTQPTRLSVVLTTYNHERFLAEAIEGVLDQQTSFPFELLVAEDHSTDGTRAIALDYARRHSDLIRLSLRDRNLGAGENYRRAIDEVRGEYVAWLDGDDYWTASDKLEKQVALLDRNPDLVSCGHHAKTVYPDRVMPSRLSSPELGRSRLATDDFLGASLIPSLSLVIRKRVLSSLPRWIYEFESCDWLTHIFSSLQGDVGFLSDVMGVYRVHEGGIWSVRNRCEQLVEELKVYDRLRMELPDHEYRIKRWICDRHCQLAVEELGVPYDSSVVMLGTHPRPIPAYFNGRDAHFLQLSPDSFQDGGRSAVSRLRQLRREAAEAAASKPHFRPPPDAIPREGPKRLYIAIADEAARKLKAMPSLRTWIEQHSQRHGRRGSCEVRAGEV